LLTIFDIRFDIRFEIRFEIGVEIGVDKETQETRAIAAGKQTCPKVYGKKTP